MYRTKIYVLACVYTIFSRFIQTETQFIHFASVYISEKGERYLEEGERRTKIYVFIQFLYTCVCIKSEEASEILERERESGERDF